MIVGDNSINDLSDKERYFLISDLIHKSLLTGKTYKEFGHDACEILVKNGLIKHDK